MQLTVISLSPHHQPQAPQWKCELLVGYPIVPLREAESFFTFPHQWDSFWWQHHQRNQIKFDICCSDDWQAGKHRGTLGKPWHRNKVLSREIQLYQRHTHWTKQFYYSCSEWHFTAIPLIDDTKSCPHFHLYSSSDAILFLLLLHCTSSTVFPDLFFLHINSVLPESKHHKAVNRRLPFSPHFIFQHGIQLLSYHSYILVSPYFIIPKLNPAICHHWTTPLNLCSITIVNNLSLCLSL